jgi:hypothetical protein
MNHKIVLMAAALRAAKRVIADERRAQFDCFTIAPDRSYDQMCASERAAIRRFDRAIKKINEALR